MKEIRMIDLPTKAEVHCSDGVAGRSTYIIGNPINAEITHLIVQSILPPFHEYLVPINQIAGTTDDQVQLKCTRDDLNQMELFEYEEYIRTELPGYLRWDDVPAIPGFTTEPVTSFISVKRQNVPPGELALCRSARVEATDGYVGEVEKLLINSNDMQFTHLVLLIKHVFEERKIIIPVSQIEDVTENTICLKLDKQSIDQLPTTSIRDLSQ